MAKEEKVKGGVLWKTALGPNLLLREDEYSLQTLRDTSVTPSSPSNTLDV